ncbi:MAG TPA: chemotaxis protein CheD [Leptospiraceae bacterium]|nr:chemotaxis protein CheD [Leptospiraceae bacterium]HMY68292.1 chemotaxis protein CheD [Leptospiraceae bacterium]HMZ61917.1 chemotaxis protein CheD [Leptospiraceae bacterium]HNF12876.1 chemotaxis protein CheD [Leptospiraceae bacterium]HNF24800.1 chemotaxis protein CheD [Leptospiraceae bacterium]
MLGGKDKVINVGIAEIQVARNPGILRTTLGSCIGIVFYQPELKIGAISHIMLAKDVIGKDKAKNPGKYGETALPKLIQQFEEEGCRPGTYSARIFGGASMFKNISSPFLQNIGENNIQIVREILSSRKIPIIAEDVGGHDGRTISLFLDDGRILMKKAGVEKFIYKVK